MVVAVLGLHAEGAVERDDPVGALTGQEGDSAQAFEEGLGHGEDDQDDQQGAYGE